MMSTLGFKKMTTGRRLRDLWKDLHLKEDQEDHVVEIINLLVMDLLPKDHVVEMDKWSVMDLLHKDHQPTPPPAIEQLKS
jgi:hypothetical protein